MNYLKVKLSKFLCSSLTLYMQKCKIETNKHDLFGNKTENNL